jgi:hypothetical protein
MKSVAIGAGFYVPGALIEVPDAAARPLIAAGVLEEIVAVPPPQAEGDHGEDRAVHEPPKDRMVRGRWRRKR